MQRIDDRLVLSPSDLVNYVACRRLTELSLEVLDGRLERPTETDPELAVVTRRGLDHEDRYLEELEASGLDVIRIPSDGTLGDRVALSLEAMARGADVVYQAAFFDERGEGPAWVGFADFLRRVEIPSSLGAFSYEPEDAKLARRVKPGAAIQLCAYAEQIERLQNHAPEYVHVKLGSGERESLRLADHSAYFRAAKARFLADLSEGIAAYPDPVEHCQICVWRERCDEQRLADDHLCTVPGLRSDQARKLREAAGIDTVGALAVLDPPVDGIVGSTLEKLQRQARLLVEARTAADGARPPYELLGPVEPGRGLGALPTPSQGDVIFDIESDPFVGIGGLEYLFGVGWVKADGTFDYRALWAHDPNQERASFESLIDFFVERRLQYPDMHIYHYAAYEPTAIGRLMGRYGSREDEVDDLFRGGVFVDLYRVLRQALCVGAPSYSLKKIEGLYLDARTQAITDGGSSIVEYERWIEEGDAQILTELEAYNRVDCDSTRLLRDFLESLRPEYEASFGVRLTRPPVGDPDAPETAVAASDENGTLKAQLALRAAREEEEAGSTTLLLGELLDWFRREAKPAWWQYFDRILRCDEYDLFDDTETIAGLVYEGIARTEAKSYIHRYRFDPSQEHKLSAGQGVCDPAVERERLLEGRNQPRPGALVSVDSSAGVLELKRGINSAAPHPVCLIPEGPIRTAEQRAALRRVAQEVIDAGIDGPGAYRAARDLLLRRPPRSGRGAFPGGSLRRAEESALKAMLRLAADLDGGALSVQGPPGSGKTYSAARVVTEIVEAGGTIGITANSHAVITNLLGEVMRCAAEQSIVVQASQKAEDAQALDHPSVTVRNEWQAVLSDLDGGTPVIAGTAWLFAREDFDHRLDYLIVDEAGQLSLANVLAVATAANNLVLVGDPRQLAQPSQGTHPEGAEASGFGHLLDGAETMPAELGLFMEHTRRLHPDICRFVSEVVYEDRLESLAGCERQALSGTGPLAGSGLRWVPVPHTDNHLSSPEEAEIAAALFGALLGRSWTNRDGTERTVTTEDILVVAPYNAQVALLREHLPSGARVGTVDKFQGQEAPVVLVSLATSSADKAPRGLSFLYSTNRLNVAVSRAKALTVMMASPQLLAANCRSVEELRLANGLCRYVELAGSIAPDYLLGSV